MSPCKPARWGLPAALLALLLWPFWFPEAALYFQVLGMAFLYGALALAWNLYALSGAISLGHAAFFGLGAYGSALLSRSFQWSTLLSIPLGALLGLAYALLWCAAFRRLRGVYLGLATLAAVEIPKVIIDNWDQLTSGSLGLTGLSRLPVLTLGGYALDLGLDLRAQYYFLFLFMVGIAGLAQVIQTSRWGWALRALQENETAATAIGIRVNRERGKALLLSAYLTGMCGGLYVHLLGLVEAPLVFNLHISALPLIFSLFGGRRLSYGPVLGALLLYPLEQLVFQPLLPMGHAAIYGIVIILTLYFFPQGITGWERRR